MKLELWQIDAFAERVFEGNPAAIVPLHAWLDSALLQRIASENNLAETAFMVRTEPGRYALRWFTPSTEVDLCGHATFASAWLVFAELEPAANSVTFDTRSGPLAVERGEGGRHVMSLPSDHLTPIENRSFCESVGSALGTKAPEEIYTGRNLFAVFGSAGDVRAIPGPGGIAGVIPHDKGLIATAAGDRGYDFVSRYFAPHHGVPEDPVTGSAHCALVPFWAKRLSKETLRARQESARGGNLLCTDAGDRTFLSGGCVLYLRGTIDV